MPAQRGGHRRRGSTMVEVTFMVIALLTLVLGMLDMGIAVFRKQLLSNAARQGARRVIVHGSLAPSGWNGGGWKTAYATGGTYGPVAANTSTPVAQAVAPFLTGMDTSAVNLTVTWLDSSDVPEKRVQVTLTTTYTPIMKFLFGNTSMTLTASSTMPIAH